MWGFISMGVDLHVNGFSVPWQRHNGPKKIRSPIKEKEGMSQALHMEGHPGHGNSEKVYNYWIYELKKTVDGQPSKIKYVVWGYYWPGWSTHIGMTSRYNRFATTPRVTDRLCQNIWVVTIRRWLAVAGSLAGFPGSIASLNYRGPGCWQLDWL